MPTYPGGPPDGDDNDGPDFGSNRPRHGSDYRNFGGNGRRLDHNTVSYAGGLVNTWDNLPVARSAAPYRIRREKTGQFNPDEVDTSGTGMITDGKNITFTDIYAFKLRVKSLIEEPATHDEAAAQIASFFQTLLGGSAPLWWTSELTVEDRFGLRKGGLGLMMKALIKQYGPDIAHSTAEYNKGKLRVEDVDEDPNAVTRWIQHKVRYAKSAGILNPDNSNWLGVLTQVWARFDLAIKRVIPPPDEADSLADSALPTTQIKSTQITQINSNSQLK
ncbi:hypothetical protein B0T26DRAFT_187420 [Lasiosphaeria miniovina]|uniref:Uncharacterized protein n=1 Tax=Lasiosphaeria miniovina TaxID=1954250 RepID=A0AA40B733_9PEZI|nr:uncharacterized protein B0T26DRAFT_187420 [Lasiosphaeria miniovina]KAK0728907.1 hypothetical protein B0T26DRAFT_187420 [Lasiosphaeria miniovina]